jgi:putative hydrolases of HD superfamily
VFDDYRNNERLVNQLKFLVEIDKVKDIVRKTKLFSGSRLENNAEHSWTVCVMAILLEEHSNVDVDVLKVIKMLLVHDLAEIDTGDTFLYAANRSTAHVAEAVCAERIFGILDSDQKSEFLSLWNEFEQRETKEARFAAVFDRLEPLLQNYLNEGFAWRKHGITLEMVLEKNKHIAEGSAELWSFVEFILADSVKRGFLKSSVAD